MVINKKIAPESLLAITYSNQAADEMRERFSNKFGKDIGAQIKSANSPTPGIRYDAIPIASIKIQNPSDCVLSVLLMIYSF